MVKRQALQKTESPPEFKGWHTTDKDEIARRKWRGKTEVAKVEAVDGEFWPFCDYRVESQSGAAYMVEWRSASKPINSCSCADFLTNRLGTCKHIESVRDFLSKNRTANYRKALNPRIEIFVDETNARKLRISQPDDGLPLPPNLKAKIFDNLNKLSHGSSDALKALDSIAQNHADLMRVSKRLESFNEAKLLAKRKVDARARFEAGLKSGANSLDFLKHQLLPYQADGVLHMAFGERVLLADEMGLGKTVQAIAACMLLKRLRGVERVLVISPASLKSEWEEQIQKFSDLPTRSVYGNILMREAAYKSRTFFTLCNYEQIMPDSETIMGSFQPDIIILDEAQRIKNWRTKTASAVKKLRSRYAFVLTGTPLENRIDEVYSIVQFLDPDLLGPLFRFNRDFYTLDERGKAVGYRNLDELNRRISSVMLRRRKLDVESELPDRTDNTYFVQMTEAQWSIYDDYERVVKRLAAAAKKRPLFSDEFKRLQMCLGCMRMVCDTPAILDQDKPYDCPKLDELEKLLPELLEEPQRKIIIFSEWIAMLELVRTFAIESEWDFAWHTGSVPQQRRRNEIKRFREDPECRLFLSSESGGVGLNLQVADTVVNLDQPWNPARLEQRISRAWRKHQTRPVSVINLVSEDTIEHRMLGLLHAKRTVAQGVIDGQGDLSEMDLPSSRDGFLEKLSEVLGSDKPSRAQRYQPQSPLDKLADSIVGRCGAMFKHVFAGKQNVLIIIDIAPDEVAKIESELAQLTDLSLNVIDVATYQSMHRLAQTGMIKLPTAEMRELFPRSDGTTTERDDTHIRTAIKLIERAERKLKAALLLEGGGFLEEALASAKDVACGAVSALALFRKHDDPETYEGAVEYLLGDGARNDAPPGVVSLLMDGEANSAAIEAAKSAIDWVRGAIAHPSA